MKLRAYKNELKEAGVIIQDWWADRSAGRLQGKDGMRRRLKYLWRLNDIIEKAV